ncbi:MAG TPA: glycoside hydrolase, partial [Clostridia bacterium]|nr:glycoside hydrolase [Clostridia bacterium]
ADFMLAEMLGVSTASLESDFSKECWAQRCAQSILAPELSWEWDCIEAPAAVTYHGKVYLFYAGAYNCAPQQVGCAVSED